MRRNRLRQTWISIWKHADKLRGADLLVWEQGTKNAWTAGEISGGNKDCDLDAKVKSADVDIHLVMVGRESAPGTSFTLQSRAADGRIWLKVCMKKYKSQWTWISLAGHLCPTKSREISQIYGLELPLFTRGPCSLSKRFFSSQLLISKDSVRLSGQGVKNDFASRSQRAAKEVRLFLA